MGEKKFLDNFPRRNEKKKMKGFLGNFSRENAKKRSLGNLSRENEKKKKFGSFYVRKSYEKIFLSDFPAINSKLTTNFHSCRRHFVSLNSILPNSRRFLPAIYPKNEL